ncbi:fimbrial protein [Cupriavidus necator]|uniref:fimbrial protein n=1 Tax=Cupriavidus necator TaxID=106590 RepID=UPI002784B413|nr:fimbrial protein [Cupriavidus necator]MDQ0141096.1 type 1 fimbria pilin [Cupriavidus necator]
MPHRHHPSLRRAIVSCTLALAALLLSVPAAADCSFVSGNARGIATISLPVQLSVPRNTAAGTILYDSGWVTAGPTSIVCTGTVMQNWGYASPMVAVPGYSNVYRTPVNGIGIKTGWANWLSGSPDVDSTALVSPEASQAVANPSTTPYGPMGRYRLQFVVTGPVMPGTITLPALLGQASYGSLIVNQLTVAGNTNIVAPACTVQNTSVVVNMPTVSASALPAAGTTAGRTGFNISLSCSGATAITMTLTDASQPGNAGSNLSLGQGSGAGGVAYQILYNGTPVSFGPDSATAGNLNQFNVGTIAGATTVTIPMAARYIRTGPLTPGTALANATFTMSYQ